MMNSDKYCSNLNTLNLNTYMTSHPRILPSTEAMLTDLCRRLQLPLNEKGDSRCLSPLFAYFFLVPLRSLRKFQVHMPVLKASELR